MFKEQILIITNLLLLADGLVIITGAYAAWHICWEMSGGDFGMSHWVFVTMVLSLMFLNSFVMGRLGFYSDRFAVGCLEGLRKVTLAVVVDFSVLTLGIFMLEPEGISRLYIGIYGWIVFCGLLMVRMLATSFVRQRTLHSPQVERVLLVGSRDRVQAVKDALLAQQGWGHRLEGWLSYGDAQEIDCVPHLGAHDRLREVLLRDDFDEVIFALPPDAPVKLLDKIESCRMLGITARIVPGMFDPGEAVRGLTVEHVGNVPTLAVYGSRISTSGLFYKRILDLFGGAVGFGIFLVMLPFVALAIRLDSPGPIFFRQTRVGRNNRHFELYKFRTMFADAEARKQELMCRNEMQGCMFKLKDDPRITPVGRFLRKTSLDEFPQFINVLCGDMSLVGTRPPTPDEVGLYEPWQRRRISMKPGITGLWQVSGRNKINDFQDVVALDLAYIDGWRFMHDIEILFKTVRVVLARDGAS
ncbi:MAG: sugar transferase [Desulfomicrobium sp.]|nr:sugar transferase [Pseudomonadota bacterium]MBV1710450.1 sugar transferase [Desulfomicrobium sp.]MBU4570071.1 sugar transferase [Pseudomonadota bacterium]MBU4593989.1 sugar transferase [Pseudomonadota bacterium]MBV1721122.1 sugar transferase [Desulfomicrobium sp.]